jgi:hypothetical protein
LGVGIALDQGLAAGLQGVEGVELAPEIASAGLRSLGNPLA